MPQINACLSFYPAAMDCVWIIRNSYTYGQSYIARNLASRTSSYVPMYRRETTANTEEKLGVSDRSRLHLTNTSSTSSPISPLATSASTSTTSTTNAVLRRCVLLLIISKPHVLDSNFSYFKLVYVCYFHSSSCKN